MEVREDSSEEVKLDLRPGRLGDWKEGQSSWSAEVMVVRPHGLPRTEWGALS